MNVNQPDINKARLIYQSFWITHGKQTSLLGYVTEDGSCIMASNTACHASMADVTSVLKESHWSILHGDEDPDDYYYGYDEEEEEEEDL